MRNRAICLLFMSFVGLALVHATFAQAEVPTVTLSTVADSTLSIPDGTGTFQTFNPNLAGYPPNPCISDGNIAFWGGGSGGQQGLYAVLSGALTAIVDGNGRFHGGFNEH